MYIIRYTMAPLVLALGLIGNSTALWVLFKAKLDKIGLVYKLLFMNDTLYLFQIMEFYLQYAFNLNLTTVSRLINYLDYQGDAISPFMLIYLSIEKYISIAYPTLTSTNNQIIYFSIVFLYCSVYTIVFGFDLIDFNQTVDSNGTYSSYT